MFGINLLSKSLVAVKSGSQWIMRSASDVVYKVASRITWLGQIDIPEWSSSRSFSTNLLDTFLTVSVNLLKTRMLSSPEIEWIFLAMLLGEYAKTGVKKLQSKLSERYQNHWMVRISEDVVYAIVNAQVQGMELFNQLPQVFGAPCMNYFNAELLRRLGFEESITQKAAMLLTQYQMSVATQSVRKLAGLEEFGQIFSPEGVYWYRCTEDDWSHIFLGHAEKVCVVDFSGQGAMVWIGVLCGSSVYLLQFPAAQAKLVLPTAGAIAFFNALPSVQAQNELTVQASLPNQTAQAGFGLSTTFDAQALFSSPAADYVYIRDIRGHQGQVLPSWARVSLPSLDGSCTFPGFSYYIRNNILCSLYVYSDASSGDGYGYKIFDISNFGSPQLLFDSGLDRQAHYSSVSYINNNNLLIRGCASFSYNFYGVRFCNADILRVFDISNPSNPRLVETFPYLYSSISNNHLFIADGSNFLAFNITTAPVSLLYQFPLSVWQSFTVKGNLGAFFSHSYRGEISLVDLSLSRVISQIRFDYIYNAQIQNDMLFVLAYRASSAPGLSLFNISNGTNPLWLARLNPQAYYYNEFLAVETNYIIAVGISSNKQFIELISIEDPYHPVVFPNLFEREYQVYGNIIELNNAESNNVYFKFGSTVYRIKLGNTLTVSPSLNDLGNYNLEILAQDSLGNSRILPFTLTVSNVGFIAALSLGLGVPTVVAFAIMLFLNREKIQRKWAESNQLAREKKELKKVADEQRKQARLAEEKAQLLSEGKRLYHEGGYEAACDRLERLRGLEETQEVLLWLGWVYQKWGFHENKPAAHEKAIVYFKAAQGRTGSHDHDICIYIADSFYAIGKKEEAKELYLKPWKEQDKTFDDSRVKKEDLGENLSPTATKCTVLRYGDQRVLKVFDTALSQAPSLFLREARFYVLLEKSPHIVEMFGINFSFPASLRFMMKYMPKKSLEHVLHDETGTTLPFKIRLDIANQLLKALIDLHEREPAIIHGDIKTANILIDDQLRPKLADFDCSSTENECPGQYYFAGTAGYEAPELMARSFGCSRAADIYALGVVLWELLFAPKTRVEGLKLEGGVQDSDAIRAGMKKNIAQQGVPYELEDNPPSGIEKPKFIGVSKLIRWCWEAERARRPTAALLSEQFIEISGSGNRLLRR